MLPPLYVGGRLAKTLPLDLLQRVSKKVVGERRTQSLFFRIENEELLVDKAMAQPLFGWGGWGRSRVFNEAGRDLSVTDGLWVISAGTNGVIGLGALLITLLLPAALVVWRIPVHLWDTPEVAPLAGLAVITLMYAIDCIPNAMANPVFHLVLGALATPLRVRELGNEPNTLLATGTKA